MKLNGRKFRNAKKKKKKLKPRNIHRSDGFVVSLMKAMIQEIERNLLTMHKMPHWKLCLLQTSLKDILSEFFYADHNSEIKVLISGHDVVLILLVGVQENFKVLICRGVNKIKKSRGLGVRNSCTC